MVDKILAHIEWLPERRKVALLDACLSVSPINCSWQQHAIAGVAVWQVQSCLAQGIEAGTVETERLDAKHESPVVEDHAPEPSTQTHTTKKKGE
jgi:hypothetical protein